MHDSGMVTRFGVAPVHQRADDASARSSLHEETPNVATKGRLGTGYRVDEFALSGIVTSARIEAVTVARPKARSVACAVLWCCGAARSSGARPHLRFVTYYGSNFNRAGFHKRSTRHFDFTTSALHSVTVNFIRSTPQLSPLKASHG